MTPKRKKIQDFVIEKMGKLAGKENAKLYEDMFESMTDKDFDEFMNKLKDGKVHLVAVVPNDDKKYVTLENNFRLASELGYDFEQRIIEKNNPERPDFMSPKKRTILYLPVRRAQQLLNKKISIPEHNLSINPITGQVAGDSRSAKITLPEQQIGIAMGMRDTLIELAKYRGGDLGGAKSITDQLFKTGRATQAEAEKFSTGVRSKEALFRWLRGMHINSTL